MMWRAALKGAAHTALGHLPGGAALYRRVTREVMGTQAAHVDKLGRVWPGYVRVWQELGHVRLEGLRLWAHEAGWTPFAAFATYLLTGRAGVLTNVEGRLHDRYLARAVNGVLAAKWPRGTAPDHRRRQVETMRWGTSVREALFTVGAQVHQDVHPADIPLRARSVDLAHSGGALEHYRPADLAAFIRECHRILRPGGIASHVVDHRDHLHHADRHYPFLSHLALPDGLYRILHDHPLGYHNRLLPAQVAGLFESAGFERIAIRRLVLPQKRYVPDDQVRHASPGLPRTLLAKRFRQVTPLDLRTAAAHYLYRKPTGGTTR